MSLCTENKPVYEKICSLSAPSHALTKDFIDSYGLSLFCCIRFYKNGEVIPLLSCADLFKEFQFGGQKLRSPSMEQFGMHCHSCPFFWDEILEEEVVGDLREKYDFHHGLIIIFRYADYCDRVYFALKEETFFAHSFYLSSIEKLKEFYRYFVKAAAPLFKKGLELKIPFEKKNFDDNFPHHLLGGAHERYIIQKKEGDTSYITGRELLCLSLLEEGQSYKTIGNLLDISPRTVETYIVRMKERTGLMRPHDIIKAISFPVS